MINGRLADEDLQTHKAFVQPCIWPVIIMGMDDESEEDTVLPISTK
jgi:hypothetical protein